jgi:uncharacterized damage-inducible protein DinB
VVRTHTEKRKYQQRRLTTAGAHVQKPSPSKLEWRELVKNREASFHSLRNLFLHMINCEDWYLHTVIPNRGGKFVSHDFEEYTSIDSIRRKMEEIEAKTRKFLESLSEEEFKKLFEYTRPDGVKRNDS